MGPVGWMQKERLDPKLCVPKVVPGDCVSTLGRVLKNNAGTRFSAYYWALQGFTAQDRFVGPKSSGKVTLAGSTQNTVPLLLICGKHILPDGKTQVGLALHLQVGAQASLKEEQFETLRRHGKTFLQ